MLRRFTNRFLAGLAVATVSMALLPSSARSQQTAAAPSPSPVPETTTGPATGQTTGGGELQQITVTGYILPHVGEGPQPVTVLGQDVIAKQANQTVSDLLQSLPQSLGAFNNVTTTGNSFSPGSTAIGLKGLPYNATLVLLDGIRMPTYPFPIVSITGGPISFVDINSFPIASVDRVEILQDGASSIYGSDAVAGVINIITKKSYQGTDLNYYFGISQRGDFEVNHVQLTSGWTQKFSDTSKLSVVAAFDYYDQTPIEAADRWNLSNLNHTEYSSKYPSQANFFSPVPSFFDPAGILFGGGEFSVKPGTTGSKITTNDFVAGAPPPNFLNQWQQVAPRDERFGGTFNAEYDVSDWLKFYNNFMIQRNQDLGVTQNQGYSSAQGPTATAPLITVPANNPYNPFGVPIQQSGFPTNEERELGPWKTTTTVRTIRDTLGATIQLPHNWDDWVFDVNYTYGESDGEERVDNSVNLVNLQEAMNGTLPGFQGQFFNPFNDQTFSSPNKALLDGIRTTQVLDSRTDISNWILKTGGNLWELPSGTLSISGGFEYRSESLIQVNDHNSEIYNIGEGDFEGPLLSGRRYIKSMYGELDVPIFGDKWSWPGMRKLDFVLSERVDAYSDFGDAAKPSVALEYKPINDLTLRATYAEGFIAPSLSQLFGTPIAGLESINDPKTGTSYTITDYTGGNRNLTAETSYGYYAGLIWSPGSSDPENSWWKWANGFTGYIDWFQTEIRNNIGELSAQDLIDLSSQFPGAVIRGPGGQITAVNATFQNLGILRTDGIDFGAGYVTKEYFWGKLDLQGDASYIYNNTQLNFVGVGANGKPKYQLWDELDSFGFPDFKMVASIFYSKTLFGIDTFKTGFVLNYVASEHDVNDNFKGTKSSFLSDAGPGSSYVHLIGSMTTVDWQISYLLGAPAAPGPIPQPGYSKDGKREIGEKAISPKTEGSSNGVRAWLANTTLTFGIKNIGDIKPPYSSDWYQGYDPANYSAIGRYFYVSVDKKF
jgi:iron complex outermembrane recepter protein